MATLDELRAITAFMKDNKLARVKIGGIEVEMQAQAWTPEPSDAASFKEAEKAMPTEDEFLRWSAPGAFAEAEDIKGAGDSTGTPS